MLKLVVSTEADGLQSLSERVQSIGDKTDEMKKAVANAKGDPHELAKSARERMTHAPPCRLYKDLKTLKHFSDDIETCHIADTQKDIDDIVETLKPIRAAVNDLMSTSNAAFTNLQSCVAAAIARKKAEGVATKNKAAAAGRKKGQPSRVLSALQEHGASIALDVQVVDASACAQTFQANVPLVVRCGTHCEWLKTGAAIPRVVDAFVPKFVAARDASLKNLVSKGMKPEAVAAQKARFRVQQACSNEIAMVVDDELLTWIPEGMMLVPDSALPQKMQDAKPALFGISGGFEQVTIEPMWQACFRTQLKGTRSMMIAHGKDIMAAADYLKISDKSVGSLKKAFQSMTKDRL
jgi:hypothetical protein